MVHFERVPPCVALEGQAIQEIHKRSRFRFQNEFQDVSVACGQGPEANCRVLVLHSKDGRQLVLKAKLCQGHLLAECPLKTSFEAQQHEGGQKERELDRNDRIRSN